MKIEELGSSQCPICGDILEFAEDDNNFVAIHCDRSFSVSPDIYKATVTKITPENINSVLKKNVYEYQEDDSESTSKKKTEKDLTSIDLFSDDVEETLIEELE